MRLASHRKTELESRDRRASTITEVLMALMIMGIGLVSLASLFPIAVLRAVKATQLTRSTNLRYNAETMIDLYPHLVHNPDRDLDPSVNPPVPYFAPNGTPHHNIDEDVHLGGNAGELDTEENDRADNFPFNDNANGFLDRPNYIVDPLGWHSDEIPLTNRLKNYFGNTDLDNNGNLLGTPVAIHWLRRFNGGFVTPAQGDYLVTFPDDWTVQYDLIPLEVQSNPSGANDEPYIQLPAEVNLGAFFLSEDRNGNGIRDPGENDLNSDPNADPPYDSSNIFEHLGSRITLFGGLTGRQSITRTITTKDIATSKIFWSASQKFDPTVFPVERVRIESQNRRFTWLLTVRQAPAASPPEASVDLVVFSNRSFSLSDERVYPPPGVALTFPAPPTTTPQLPNRTSAFEANRADSNLVYVAYNPSIPDSRPFLKKGGYVLDAMNALWYRVQDFRDNPPGTNAGTIEIEIDRPAVASSLSVVVNSAPPSAIFMQNIVDVYPLGSR